MLSLNPFFLFFRLTVAQGLRSNSSLGLAEDLLDLIVFLIEICLFCLEHNMWRRTQHVERNKGFLVPPL